MLLKNVFENPSIYSKSYEEAYRHAIRKNTITEKPLISISIPLFNEEKYPILYSRLTRLADKIEERYNWVVFSDNHSDDSTWEILAQLAEQDTRIKALRLSKNFGFQRSILANFMHTQGDAVMQLDATQDPLRNIGGIFKKWNGDVLLSMGLEKKEWDLIFNLV